MGEAPKLIHELQLHKGASFSGALSSDGKHVAAAGGGEVRVWTVPDGKPVIQMQLPDKDPAWVAFAEDGKHLISTSPTDRKIRFWSLTTGKQTKELDLPKGKGVQWIVGFSPRASRVAVKVTDGIYLADPTTGKITAEFPGAGPSGPLSFRMRGGSFSRDGKRFAAGIGKGQFAVWSVETGKQLAASTEARVSSGSEFVFISFSPDDNLIATGDGGSIRQSIRIWNTETCELLCEPMRSNGYTGGVEWYPDGSAIVSHGKDRVESVDIATEKSLHNFSIFEQGGTWLGSPAGATPDGKYLLFFYSSRIDNSTHSLYFFNCPPSKKPTPPKSELNAMELDALWSDMNTPNKIRLAQIKAAFTAALASAVPYLAKKVPIAAVDDLEAIRKLIARLDDDDPAVRKSAQDDLAARAHRFEPVMRDALAKAPAGEIRNRMTFLLGELKEKPMPKDLQAELRALNLLGAINTLESRKVLEALAAGVPQSVISREAATKLKGSEKK